MGFTNRSFFVLAPVIAVLLLGSMVYIASMRKGVPATPGLASAHRMIEEREETIRQLRARVFNLENENERRGQAQSASSSSSSATSPSSATSTSPRKHYELKMGVMPAGNDVFEDLRLLSLEEAASVCYATPECKGFTLPYSGSQLPTPEQPLKGRHQVFLKTSAEVHSDSKGWLSVVLPWKAAAHVEEDPGYHLFFKYRDFIEASYDAEKVAKYGPTPPDALDMFPEFKTDEIKAKAFRYASPGPDRVMLSLAPRVYFIPNVISEHTAHQIIERARIGLSRSLVAQGLKKKNGSGVDSVRTSSGTWLDDSFEYSKKLRDRVQEVTGVARKDFEMLQILRYQKTQKYGSHVDYFHPRAYGPRDNNRMATMITFLSNVTNGGHSAFPNAHGSRRPGVPDCQTGLRVKPLQGSSVLFYSMREDKNFDPFSLHGGCPVGEGPDAEKWVAVQWLDIDLGSDGLPPESRI